VEPRTLDSKLMWRQALFYWEVTWRLDTSNQLISSSVAPQGGGVSGHFRLIFWRHGKAASNKFHSKAVLQSLLVRAALPTLQGEELTLSCLKIDTRFDRCYSYSKSSVSQDCCRRLARFSGVWRWLLQLTSTKAISTSYLAVVECILVPQMTYLPYRHKPTDRQESQDAYRGQMEHR